MSDHESEHEEQQELDYHTMHQSQQEMPEYTPGCEPVGVQYTQGIEGMFEQDQAYVDPSMVPVGGYEYHEMQHEYEAPQAQKRSRLNKILCSDLYLSICALSSIIIHSSQVAHRFIYDLNDAHVWLVLVMVGMLMMVCWNRERKRKRVQST